MGAISMPGHLPLHNLGPPMTARRRWFVCSASLLVAGVGCGGGGPSGPTIRTPTTLTMVSGDGQQGAAGNALTSQVAFRVSDARGPIADVRVRFTVEQGGGSVSPTSVITGADGLATVSWTVGTAAGLPNLLRASIDGTTLTAAATAAVVAGPPALLAVVGGGGQFAPVGQALAEPVAVRVTDLFSNPVAGVSVSFAVVQGGGSLAGAQATSNAQGIAQTGQWTLGPGGGLNALRATLGTGTFVDVQAVGTAFALRLIEGDDQAANRGTPVPVAPTVIAVNPNEEPLAGISVSFTVSGGGGQVIGGNLTTGPDGRAKVTSWILGPVAGPNILQAASLGVEPVVFTAEGLQPIPATVEVSPPATLSAFAGNFLNETFTVRVLDGDGAPIAFEPVVWTVGSGGGQIFGPAGATDTDGYATLLAWRLGSALGAQTLQAHVNGLPPAELSVTATEPPVGEFTIELRYLGDEPAAAHKAAVEAAAAFWQQVIVGDLTPVNMNQGAIGPCGAVNEVVDDILIFVRIEPIDGPSGILGSAGPCWVRQSNTLPVVGGIRLDVADVDLMAQLGLLAPVVVHEMAHVLGFGTIWPHLQLLIGGGTADPYFVGTSARRVFETMLLDGFPFTGNRVPVENVGGQGSVDGHWRESVFRNELMTSLINSGANPISALSLAALRDMGYIVNDAVADPYTLEAALFAAPPTQAMAVRFADVHRGPIGRLDPAGRLMDWLSPP